MTPRLTRRHYITALSVSGLTAFAGCTESLSDDGNDTDAPTDTDGEPTDETPASDDQRTETEASDPGEPGAVVEAYVEATETADDPAAVGAYFHPIHPFHPDNIDPEDAEVWLLRDDGIDEVETETLDQPVDTDLVRTAPILGAEVEQDAVADAIEGQETAVVDATVTEADGGTTEFRVVTVTVDGQWTILAQGVELDDEDLDEGNDSSVVRVVDDVTFDTDADTARVRFVDSLEVDSITVEAKHAVSSRSSDTPRALEYIDVSLDPEGDDVVVTATVEGESRIVHRERYPKSHRVVEEISQEQAETDVLGERARVTFTGSQEGDRLRVESIVADGEASSEPADPVEFLTLGVDPNGDRIIVTLTENGERTEVHRERYQSS